jgi:hypothetical protein
VFFVLEKRFIGADDFGVFAQTLADSRAQADETFNAICRHKRVAKNLLGFLADTIHTAGTLDEADDGPRQIEVHDDGGVLQVLTFAQDIGGDQHAQFIGRRNVVGRAFVLCLVAFRTEPAGVVGRVSVSPVTPAICFQAARFQLFGQIDTVSANWEKTRTFWPGCFFARSLSSASLCPAPVAILPASSRMEKSRSASCRRCSARSSIKTSGRNQSKLRAVFGCSDL